MNAPGRGKANGSELHAEVLLQEVLLLLQDGVVLTRPLAKVTDFNSERNFQEVNPWSYF